jgi:hypothetical protein
MRMCAFVGCVHVLGNDRQVLWRGAACVLKRKLGVLYTYRDTYQAYCGEMVYDRTIMGIARAHMNEINCDGVEMQG